MNVDKYDLRYRAPWMDEDQWACALLIRDLSGGFHHAHKMKACGQGLEVSVWSGKLATFDSDGLTALVFMAHDRGIRAEIASSGPRRVKIILHKRKGRAGSIFERHPTIEQALEMHRRYYPAEEVAS